MLRPMAMMIVALAVLALTLPSVDAWAADSASSATATSAAPAATDSPAKTEAKSGETSAAAQKPANPFGKDQEVRRPDALSGVVEQSDGRKFPGDIFITRGADLKVFDRDKKQWRFVPLAAILSIETLVEWERLDDEWHFKTAGSPEKIYTGKKYPNRMYWYAITLRDQTKLDGDIEGAPLYVQATGGRPQLFVLHQRHKGEVGSELKDLLYVKSVRFGDAERRQAEEELKKKAEEESKKK
jgi:hypothetical protein